MAVAADPREAAVLQGVPKQLLIGGRWVDGSERTTFPVEDPATGETIAEVADATPGDALAALGAAHDAQAEWGEHPPRERGEILRRAYEVMMDRLDDLALLMTLEMGKPVAESKAEVSYAAEFFRWFAEQAVRIDGRFQVAPNGQGRLLVMKQPVGPCYLITPWNFPAAMATRKIGPAVAAGCTMVLKPAGLTPLSALAVAKILEEVGLPGGVLNVITSSSSSEVSKPIIGDFRLRKLSFTGSTEVGRKLVEQSAQQLLRVSMELGGNAPFLVFGDADLDAAVEGALIAKMRNIGEACTAANRLYAADSIAQEFAERLAERMGSMKVGRGTDDDVKVGPLIDEDQRSKVEELVQDAVQKGAQTLSGGERPDGPGYFYPPTVLTDVSDDARLLKEEIFGPVAPVRGFSSEDEAIAQANDTEFGLVAYLYTRDLGRAFRAMERLEYGMIGLNQGMVSNPAAPFGGIKQSGFGREGGYEGIQEYLETKYCAITP
jgi:succinate-semialdehyde dehydrogenase/glutarate-semialdehyde dehydrogenase